jgi:serine/threonine protein kinase
MLQSHNFLVDDDWRVKVADFGISKVLDSDTAFTQCGTTGWYVSVQLVQGSKKVV